jgi:DNA topoisomerase-2
LICAQVSFTVTALSGAKLDEAEKAPGGLLKKFKLESSMATSNMNFFDSGGVAIERYATPFDICKAFYKVRLETYAKRKVRDAASVSRRRRRDSRVDGV